MRKIIPLFAVLLIIISIAASPLSVFADDTVYTEGSLYYTIDNLSITVTGCFSKDEVVTVPNLIAGIPVNHIAAEAFANCSALKTVKLPDTIVSVGENAFPDNVTVVYNSNTDHPSEIFSGAATETGNTTDTAVATDGTTGQNNGGKKDNSNSLSNDSSDTSKANKETSVVTDENGNIVSDTAPGGKNIDDTEKSGVPDEKNEGDIEFPSPETRNEATDSEENGTDTKNEAGTSSKGNIYCIIGCVIVAAAIVVVIIIIVKKRKNKSSK